MDKIVVIWALVGGIFGGLVQMMFASQDRTWNNIEFGDAFWFVRNFWFMHEDQLNRAGLIIGSIFITILVLPGSLLLIAMSVLFRVFEQLFRLFKYIFRKRVKNG